MVIKQVSQDCSKKPNYHKLFKCRMCQKLRFNKLMSGHKHDPTLLLQSIRNRLAQSVCVCMCVCVLNSSSRNLAEVSSMLIPKQQYMDNLSAVFLCLGFPVTAFYHIFPHTTPRMPQSDHELKWKCWRVKASEHEQQFPAGSIVSGTKFLKLYWLIFCGHLGAEEPRNKLKNTQPRHIIIL